MKKFTVIELLILVAIIAILTSLLLPALKVARERSKMAVCKNNMKQIHYALFMYQDDNNGYFPYSRITNPNQYSWDDLLSPYDGRNITNKNALKYPVILKKHGYNCDLYLCPSDTKARTHRLGDDKILPASYALTHRQKNSYGNLTGWSRGVTGPDRKYTQNIKNISSPSTTLTMVELSHKQRIVGFGTYSYMWADSYKNKGKPHKDYGKNNYLFADGSVQTLSFLATLSRDDGGIGTPSNVRKTMWDSDK